MTKLFEKLLLKRVKVDVNLEDIICFISAFVQNIPQPIHRIVNTICITGFLDIEQAFDTVWHTGLLYKLKHHLPSPYYLL